MDLAMNVDEGLISMERAVLSALLDKQDYEAFATQLHPSDFYYPIHQLLFEFCQELYLEQKPVDARFLKQKIQMRNNEQALEALSIILGTSPLADLQAYIRAIKDATLRRHLLQLSLDIRTQCYQDKATEGILDNIEATLYQMSLENSPGGFKDVRRVVKDTLTLIKEAKEKGNQKLTGLDTGFYELNEKTGGFQPGDLVVIGARPSMGKTSLVLNLAQTTLNHRQGVAIFSMEMGAEQLMMRMLSSNTSLHLHDLKIGNCNDEDWEKLAFHAEAMNHKPLFIDDVSLLTIQHIRSKLRQLKNKHPEVALAIIDYLQLMSGEKGDLKRNEQIAQISRGLKTLARELNVTIIALSQLNRALESREDRRPILSDLKESGAIEQDADQVLFLYRDEVYKKRDQNDRLAKLRKEGKDEEAKKLEKQFYEEKQAHYEANQGVEGAEIILAKNRNGDIGTIKIGFNKSFTRFQDLSKKTDEQGDQTPTNMAMPVIDGIPF
ncbi:replicative DNA helicase [Helicobacter ailurogastricus]|uniref:Replicative DNA helicase n=1 Tax=Helicobacter ailurogastricus TaxID=1578720 RepID=A0A0K2X5F0_9HELI|nr:replicative DNA helicase [Helicobacter ailurogastricus]CRF41236.1 Replicative DNA helicase (DnaB) [Helicobacter ailurogastricus]CRF41941.1 Replicative DNA helicase (DnaB) [Helicobacter ailurogastricus]CRF43784.1 Replicative DNA helicase (DnaB) [Helicobacter ailurogastricus]